MANNVDLYTFASLANDTSATTNLNSNSEIITTALANTLALDGTQPNSMQADLDMNNFAINNLPLPTNQTSPLRLMDVSLLNGGGTIEAFPLPVGGTTGQVLAKSDNNNYDVQWNSPQVVSTSGSSSLTLVGSTLGTAALAGDVTTSVNSFSTTIASNAVSAAKFRQSNGLSVVGNPTNSNANVLDITGSANQVLSVNSAGNSLGFVPVSGDVTNSNGTFTISSGAVTGSKITSNTVQNSNLSQVVAATLKGNPTASSANVIDFTIQGLTNDSSPDANNDKVLIFNHTTGTLQYSTPGQISAAGTAGVSAIDTLTGAFTTGNGITSSGSEIQLTSARRTLPTRQILISGSSATYTTPTNCLYIKVRAIGGGGGGGGGNISGGAGSNGVTTSFGSFTAVGGAGGGVANGAIGGVAGAGGSGGSGSAFRIPGSGGCSGAYATASTESVPGGQGGTGPFGGNGTATNISSTPTNCANNSGAGGAGTGNVITTPLGAGGGGGSGEYIEFTITGPASTYTYTIGSGGAGGLAGGGSSAGANGGSGVIIVDEFYGS